MLSWSFTGKLAHFPSLILSILLRFIFSVSPITFPCFRCNRERGPGGNKNIHVTAFHFLVSFYSIVCVVKARHYRALYISHSIFANGLLVFFVLVCFFCIVTFRKIYSSAWKWVIIKYEYIWLKNFAFDGLRIKIFISLKRKTFEERILFIFEQENTMCCSKNNNTFMPFLSAYKSNVNPLIIHHFGKFFCSN